MVFSGHNRHKKLTVVTPVIPVLERKRQAKSQGLLDSLPNLMDQLETLPQKSCERHMKNKNQT